MRTSPALDLHFPADSGASARLIARVDDFSPVAIHELGSDDAPIWRVFFAGSRERDEAAAILRAEFGPDGIACEGVDVPDEDWAARSQAGLRAVRVGRIVVAPPWDALERRSGSESGGDVAEPDILIVIQPSMGFGTGHHETTRLCLGLLQETDVRGREVLDVGTGSGVLAIAAARLGARHVRAVDVDDDALASARENVELNAASLRAGAAIAIGIANLRDGMSSADLVVANLTGALLVSAAEQLRRAVLPGGVLLVSGFQPHETDFVLAALLPANGRADRRREGEWEAAVLRGF